MHNSNLDEVPKDLQAEFLIKNGDFIAEGSTYTLTFKYYSYGDDVYKISYYDGKAVAIMKMSKDEMGRILSCSDIEFDD